uniref:PB1 domain-containing protein n=1 Tax=Manihot esculenta TaxID=3983 RepID=A0A2C9U7R8_MANES
MASLHASELDYAATDSVTSSPRSDHYGSHDPCVRFMCSFGGKILPRPHDNQLRYVGGETRIVAVHRSISYSSLLTKLSKLSGLTNLSVKYQLPNEDLDALISVTTDEDIDNMLEEYDRVLLNQNPRSARLRLFLFSKGEDSRVSSISSLLDGSTNREHWFFDALNAGSRLERGRSEASSIVSEVPDYLFGLDNSEDPQPREPKMKSRFVMQDNVSASDPGSPAPVISSPYCSTSSAMPIVPSIPDLPPVKTKLENRDPVIQPKQNTTNAGSSETIEPVTTQPTGVQFHRVMSRFNPFKFGLHTFSNIQYQQVKYLWDITKQFLVWVKYMVGAL